MFQSIINTISVLGVSMLILGFFIILARIKLNPSKRERTAEPERGRAYVSSVRFNGQGPSSADLENEIESLKRQLPGYRRVGARIIRRNF